MDTARHLIICLFCRKVIEVDTLIRFYNLSNYGCDDCRFKQSKAKPKLLDLFCGAGGAAMGYHRAGFKVTGVDIKPQKNYPFKFIQGDALDYAERHGKEFDVIHASPPCQGYSVMKSFSTKEHPMLIDRTREILQASAKPFVIENVEGAPLYAPLRLCGTMFGLNLLRHRLFETKPLIFFPPFDCSHIKKSLPKVSAKGKWDYGEYYFLPVGGFSPVAEGRKALQIDWMNRYEMSQAIPPAYAEYLGKQLLAVL